MSYRGAIVDLDGTVYRGRSLIPGADAGIDALRNRGIAPLFVSNNPTKARGEYVDRLSGMGLDVAAEAVVSSGTVTTRYLTDHHPGDGLFVIGSSGLCAQFESAGLSLTDDPREAAVLVASWTQGFDYDSMTDALRALGGDQETAFVGTDPDVTVPTENGPVPGSGAIIRAIAGVTERDPDRVLGKPSAETREAALSALGVPPEDCLVIGDRIDTDIAMGAEAGMTTVLVLTGVTGRAKAERSDITPDHVIDSLADIERVLGD